MMVMTGKARNEMKNHWHVMTLIVFVVMLQFGDLLVVSGNQIVDKWPVFHQTG